jgi:hypothetical protein
MKTTDMLFCQKKYLHYVMVLTTAFFFSVVHKHRFCPCWQKLGPFGTSPDNAQSGDSQTQSPCSIIQ